MSNVDGSRRKKILEEEWKYGRNFISAERGWKKKKKKKKDEISEA